MLLPALGLLVENCRLPPEDWISPATVSGVELAVVSSEMLPPATDSPWKMEFENGLEAASPSPPGEAAAAQLEIVLLTAIDNPEMEMVPPAPPGAPKPAAFDPFMPILPAP